MTDWVLDWMKLHGVRVTRETYLALNYGNELPDPWTPELEAELPKGMRGRAERRGRRGVIPR